MTLRLGDLLVRHASLPRESIDRALEEQRHHGARLGEILTAQGDVTPLALHQALAEHQSLPFANLLTHPPQPALLRDEHAADYLRLRVIPWKQENGRITFAAAEYTPAAEAWIAQHYGAGTARALTAPYDIRRAVEQHFGAALEQQSRLRLYETQPLHSARTRFSRSQRLTGNALGASFLAALAIAPVATVTLLLIALNAMYATVMLFKWAMFFGGRGGPAQGGNVVPLLAEKDLPVYTILVPLYREAESLPYILASLGKLDYPRAKLDVKLVLEQDDEETYRAALALKPAWHFDIVRVPPSQPRTKPKACNYALRFARGEFITIYDAEDEPNPMQLKAAIAAFSALPEDIACLQARLNYYNAADNMLTRWFAIEYAILFARLLPGLERAGIPIPLGGTSNHISRERLQQLGEWDPYNVTEDADLGIRLASHGYRTAMLDSLTLEEAPAQLGPWLRQRSRWIKGYMQTWLVHMRAPGALLRNGGALGFAGFQLFVGCSSLAYMSAPFVWLFAMTAWALPGAMSAFTLPDWFAGFCLFNLALHLVAHWQQAFAALRYVPASRTGRIGFYAAALSFPFYWVLHSIASYRALIQLIRRPHFWEKTEHNAEKRDIFQRNNGNAPAA